MRYVSLIVSGEVVAQVQIHLDVNDGDMDDFIINIDTMLQKNNMLSEDIELAVTEDI